MNSHYNIECWMFDRLYRYLWGGTTDLNVLQTRRADLRDRLEFLVTPDINNLDFTYYYVVALDGEKIIGLLQYATKKQYHLAAAIGVDPQYRKQGVSKALIHHWLQYVYKPELGICDCTDFTEDGFNWIKPQLEALTIPIKLGEKF